jgi:AcrR family transcriptional regulator
MLAMPRSRPESRLHDLLACATEVFIAQGYRRTQISDVAEALGVAKGTVYLYVKSKEALFYAALRYAGQQAPPASDSSLPLDAPDPETMAGELRERLASEAIPPALARALDRRRVTDATAEFEEIVRELYAGSSRYRHTIQLIDRCARDHPELAKVFYEGGRFAQLEVLTRYLEARIRSRKFPAVADAAVAARFVIESITTWAVHIHWDPSPQPITPQLAEDTVVEIIVRGIAGPTA